MQPHHKGKFCFLLYAQFVESNGLVKHNIYQELKPTIMDLDFQITRKHHVNRYYELVREDQQWIGWVGRGGLVGYNL